MTFLGESGEPSAVVMSEGEQRSRPGVGRAVALGSQTGEEFGLFRSEMAEGSEVAAHFHRTFSESFYVLSGRLELWTGDATAAVTRPRPHDPEGRLHPRGAADLPGDRLALVADQPTERLVVGLVRGIHGLRAIEGPADVLTLFVPGIPRERFVLELLEIRQSGRQLTQEEWADFYARHDQYLA